MGSPPGPSGPPLDLSLIHYSDRSQTRRLMYNKTLESKKTNNLRFPQNFVVELPTTQQINKLPLIWLISVLIFLFEWQFDILTRTLEYTFNNPNRKFTKNMLWLRYIGNIKYTIGKCKRQKKSTSRISST